MNKRLEGDLRTVSHSYDGSLVIRTEEAREIVELIKENDELKAKIKVLNKEALYWKQAMIDLEINRGSKSE